MAGESVDHRKSLATPPLGRLDDLRALSERAPFDAAVLVSIMPHGRPQIVRASVPDAELVRRYNRDEHVRDRATWESLRADAPLRDVADPILPGRSIVLPAGAPVLAGYPAVLHVFRHGAEVEFSDADVSLLRARDVETGDQLVASRVFVLDRDLQPLIGADAWENLDPDLRHEITHYTQERFTDLSDDQPQLTDRRPHGAGRAKRQIVRYVFSRDSAAHPGQAGVVVALQPDVDEWAELSPDAVASHVELARFLPALKFMRGGACKSVTLIDVANSVGLSPFHFHRRFVDLTGMAPKQYLFDCQIADAQKLLLEGKVELYTIAKQTGFAHQSHFTSRFRQATGLTPTKWRKAVMESQSV